MDLREKTQNNIGLSAKRERFCREYVIDFNGTRAYIRARYSKNGASQGAERLLKNADVEAFIGKLEAIENEKLAKKYEITNEKLLRERHRLAFFDPRDLYNDDGSIKKPSEWSGDVAAAVASVKEKAVWAGQGEDRKVIGKTTEVRMWNKDGSLSALEKIKGLYEADNRQKNPLNDKTTTELLEMAKMAQEKIDKLVAGYPAREQDLE